MIECPNCNKKVLTKDINEQGYLCTYCRFVIHYYRIEEVKGELIENGFFQMGNSKLTDVYYTLLKESFPNLYVVTWGIRQYFVSNQKGKVALNNLLLDRKEEMIKCLKELDNVIYGHYPINLDATI